MKFHLVIKEVKSKKDVFRQFLKKYLEISHALAQFPYTKSETELDYYHQMVNVQVA